MYYSSTMASRQEEERKKEVPPLSLVPDDDVTDEQKSDSTKYSSFKLLASPGTVGSTTKYTFTIMKVDGSQSIRDHIRWSQNIAKVFTGLGITDCDDKRRMTEELCSGSVLTAYIAGIDTAIATRWEVERADERARVFRTPATATGPMETYDHWMDRVNAAAAGVAQPVLNEDDLLEGIGAVLTAVCPYKVLEKQKSFMRRKMRKPREMTTRQYVNHLTRINELELVYLPPFRRAASSFTVDEFKEIVLYGIPNSWRKDMDKFDFDPYASTVRELVEFCERMEASDEQSPTHRNEKNDNGSSSKKSKPSSRFDKYSHSKKKNGGGKWCDYHEVDTHNTKDCQTIKKLKASKGPPKKEWKSKSDYAKDKAKKELNTLKKKASNKKKTELNAIAAKKRKATADSDDESFHSMNALEKSMKDVDKELVLLAFSDNESEGELHEVV